MRMGLASISGGTMCLVLAAVISQAQTQSGPCTPGGAGTCWCSIDPNTGNHGFCTEWQQGLASCTNTPGGCSVYTHQCFADNGTTWTDCQDAQCSILCTPTSFGKCQLTNVRCDF